MHPLFPSVNIRVICADSSSPTARRCAFTLIELIVVVIILSVVAAAIVPRLAADDSRRAALAARAARNLLSIAAHRDSLAGRRLAIAFERDSNSLALESLRADDAGPAWRTDPLIDPVPLDPLTLRAASLDGTAIDTPSWRVELPRHAPRPLITLSLEHTPSRAEWIVALLPAATQADLLKPGETPALLPIDLDAQGLGRLPW